MIDRRVLTHFENALTGARNAPDPDICEMLLNQATGMIEALFLIRHEGFTAEEFDLNLERIRAVRVQRETMLRVAS